VRSLIKLFIFIALTIGFSFSMAETEGLLNKLLAPGPLMQGHKDLEGNDCLKCHDAGKGISSTKCMDCHKDIKKAFDSKSGFHGINTQACIKCHSDHKGRDFDSTTVDTKSFDHAKLTGYSLEGKHASIKCLECHTQKRTDKVIRKNEIKFFGQASTCVSCHKKDDVHFFKGDFGKKDCIACHTNKSWTDQVKFNHNADTKFKLVGRHAEMKCNDCHQPDKKQKKVMKYAWANLQTAKCLACHQDQHKKNLGPRFSGGDCTVCHSQSLWKIEKFNHDITNFKLKGRHIETACIDCHKPAGAQKAKGGPQALLKNLNFTGLKTQCLSCHQDFHKFGGFKSPQMGDLNQCLKCHTEKDWQSTHSFDHNQNTRFALDGEHLGLKCTDCHLPNASKANTPKKNQMKTIFTVSTPTYHWKNLDLKTCETCHKSPHVGVFSPKLLQQKCTTCHTTEGWAMHKSGTGFDHSKTRFPLTGAHQSTKCADCHTVQGKQVFKFKSAPAQLCAECHTNIHINQFSTTFSAQSCTQCHTTKNFTERLDFDHSKTKYPLMGQHSNLKCAECHKASPMSINLKWPNFKTKEHNKLKTISRGLFQFPEVAIKACLACHSDYHKGQLSANCTECHSEKAWKPTSFVHNQQSRFKLVGSHQKLDCNQCHLPSKSTIAFKNQIRPVVIFKPLKSNCIDCHTDFHRGQLSSNCTECHTERAWKPTSFIHNKQSDFKLKGKHEKLDCVKCHLPTRETVVFKNQTRPVIKFKQVGTACIDCHKDPHKGNFGRNCQECHAEKSWRSTKDFHKNFTLTGVHYSLDCAECHKDGRKLSGQSQQCLSCHQKDDIHNGTLPNCKSCHTQHFWEVSKFRHSLTRFPLRGAHRTLDCAECHTNGVYKGLSSTCVNCHLPVFLANPGPHGTGNTNCIECHKNTFTFKSAN
jgi:hypothetical protein